MNRSPAGKFPSFSSLVLCLIFMGAFFGGCASSPTDRQDAALPSAQEAVRGLRDRSQAVRSFQMQGEIHLSTPDMDLVGDHVIVGKSPDLLRAEILGPFGQPLVFVVLNGDSLVALDYKANRAYRGRASRRNLARFLGMALSSKEVFTLLSGSAPIIEAGEARVHPDDKPGRALLKLLAKGGGLGEGMVFSLSDYALHQAWLRQWTGLGGQGGLDSEHLPLDQDSSVLLDCRFDDFINARTGRYPKRISIRDNQSRKVSLKNFELLINPQLDGALFEAKLPKGVAVSPLE